MQIASFINNEHVLTKIQKDIDLTNFSDYKDIINRNTWEFDITLLHLESLSCDTKDLIEKISEKSKIILLSNVPTYDNLKEIFSNKIYWVLNSYSHISHITKAIDVVWSWKLYLATSFLQWFIDELLRNNEIKNKIFFEMPMQNQVLIYNYLKTENREDLLEPFCMSIEELNKYIEDIMKLFWVNDKLALISILFKEV